MSGGFYESRVFPWLNDRFSADPSLEKIRADAVAPARGRVVEIGFGSGLNLRFYPLEVSSVAAVEPSDVGWKLSAERRARTDVRVERSGLDGQHLAEDDASFDSALVTFSLCSIADPALALDEVRRVLKPGASLHFLEHGLAPDAGVARWQRRLDPVQRRVFAGCHLSRDVAALVGAAGLEVTELRTEYQPGPRVARPWTYGYLGRAVRAGDA